jgi:hypothetical protein
MAEKDFRKLVDDYLTNRISPDELKWLRQKVASDEQCKQIFQRKCSQHQVSQYFMVQEAPPSIWQTQPEEDSSSVIHLKNDSPLPSYDDESGSMGGDFNEPAPVFRIRDFIDFAFLSGLACISFILLICWLDRSRIFSPPTLPPSDGDVQAIKTIMRELEFTPGVYHNLISPTNAPEDDESGNDKNWLTLNQLDWYVRNLFPQSIPLDHKKLKELQQTWELPASIFPHTILTLTLQTQ